MSVSPNAESAGGADTSGVSTVRLVPLLMALYFVNFLDRTNLGIAKAEISADLQLSATMFGLASGIFFIGYVLVEVPSNLALVRFGARRWLARIAVSWGIVAVAIAFAPNASTLLVLRFLLGVAEAVLFPGHRVLSEPVVPGRLPGPRRRRLHAGRPHRLRGRNAIGSLADSNRARGLRIGRLAVHGDLCGTARGDSRRGLLVLSHRPAPPTRTGCRTHSGIGWSRSCAEEHRQISNTYDFPLRRALTSPRVWALALVYFGIAYGLYALAFFLPSIVAGFKKTFGVQLSLIEVGLITAVPYLFGAASMFLWSRHADRTREHVWHVAIPLLMGGLAIPVALYLRHPIAVMVPVTIAAMGIFAALPVFWALPSRFLAGAAAAGGIGLINSLGNLGGFAAPYATGALNDLTGTNKAGMWAVGVSDHGSPAAALVVWLCGRSEPRRAEPPDHGGEYPRSQPTG